MSFWNGPFLGDESVYFSGWGGVYHKTDESRDFFLENAFHQTVVLCQCCRRVRAQIIY